MDATTLTIEVASLDDVRKQIKAVFRGKADETHRYTFLSPEAMAQALTPPRWIILRTLAHAMRPARLRPRPMGAFAPRR